MTLPDKFLFRSLRYDAPAALVVFLVALPLCLGIALASGVPLFSGIIAGVVGGVVVGLISRSPLSVSGPAAGLTVIVLAAVNSLPSLEAFFLAVMLAGGFQMILGLLRAGLIGDFIPSAVIKGMLAAIGLILILKQIPHAVGYDHDYEGDFSFFQPDGDNTFSALLHMLNEKFTPGAITIALISLIFLFWWDASPLRKKGFLQYIPGPLVVVIFGISANEFFKMVWPSFAIIDQAHMVTIPVADSFNSFLGQFRSPDFSMISHPAVWTTALTLGLVATVETLLSIEAVDKLDPYKRNTPANRELFAQGAGNIVSGLLGGLPVTSVIVRSSANVDAGARTRLSGILHGVLLFICVATIPFLLNKIPLSALAAVLIAVGYKLTKPSIFIKKYKKGWAHLIPFVLTIVAILLTDLLIGIGIGLVFSALFIIRANYHSAILHVSEGNKHLLRFKKDLSFLHKYELKRFLNEIPEDAELIIDVSRTSFIDLDNSEIINDFIEASALRGVKVTVRRLMGQAEDIIPTPETI